jgi:enamine deaminase RidA (YjgF/YER057c/UK114 family)
MSQDSIPKRGGLIRLQREGRLFPVGTYSDLVIREELTAYVVYVSGIAACDPTTGIVAGYEAHSGEYATNALELQVADVFCQLDRHLTLLADNLNRRCVVEHVEDEAKEGDVSMLNLCKVVVCLRGDRPMDFRRFDDAYRAEFTRRGIGSYPCRTTTMGHHLPTESALVEMDFELWIPKVSEEIKKTLRDWGISL